MCVIFTSVRQYAEKLCSDKKNGHYIKLIPTQQVYIFYTVCSNFLSTHLDYVQLESVLGKIKKAGMKEDKPISRLEPLELPSPVNKRGTLQPLTSSTARSLEDNHVVDKLLGKSNDGNRLKPRYPDVMVDTSSNIKTSNKDSDKLSSGHPRGLNDAINNQRMLTDTLLKTQDDPPIGLDGDKATAKSESLQLSSASIPSEISEAEDEDFENMTEEGILEKLIALPSNSGDEDDLNKVSDDILKQKKKEMDKDFEQNQLKPGDEGYEYDKEINFDADDDKVSCGWDSSNSDVEYF